MAMCTWVAEENCFIIYDLLKSQVDNFRENIRKDLYSYLILWTLHRRDEKVRTVEGEPPVRQ